MSMLHGQHPPYTEVQALASTSVSPSEANLQQSILNLATQDPASLPQNLSLSTEVFLNPGDAENFRTFKQSIFKHSLFPLLAMVFDKCEHATYSPDLASLNFEKELQAFMNHQEALNTPLLGPDTEVNEVMVKAIQVLRIHLLEVEKVNELCKDFCTRYISCLKGKLTSEQLLHVEGCDSPEPQDLSQSSQTMVSLNSAVQVPQQPLVASAVVGGSMLLQQQQQQQPQIVSGNTVYQMVHTPQGIVAQPIQIQGPLTPLNQPVQQVIHGSTPLSQIGVSLTSPPHQQQPPQQQLHMQQQQQQTQHQHPDIKSNMHRMSEDEDEERNSKQKRGILPKQATQIMKSWLFQHIVHPYPTEDEKRQIASQTNLTLLQVNNWFINARRRILQPMLEASNLDKAKAKKPSKPGNKPQQRFWPIQPNSSLKEDKEEDDDLVSKPHVLTPKSPRKTAAASSATVSSATTAGSAAERAQQQIITTDTTLASQPDTLMGFMSNGGFVLKLSPDGHLIPSTSMTTQNPTSISLENLQAFQSSGFVFAPGPTSLPFSLPLSALSPSAGAGLGLGMGHFSGLTSSPMTLSGLNFVSPYSAPLQFANCINAAPIDLSAMSASTALQLSTLANSAAHNTFHLGGHGQQMFMGVSVQDANGDLSMGDTDESPEAGELKIDTSEVHGIHDVGEG